MNDAALNAIADGLADSLREHVTRRLSPIETQLRDLMQRADAQSARLADLARRIEDLEARDAASAEQRRLRAV